MKKYISMIVASLMAVSCVDTLILPNDKTVEEDFWKSKSDVQLMVNGAYKAMLADNVIARLVVWGGLRSEELLPVGVSSVSTDRIELVEDMVEINLANIKTDNEFAKWGDFYGIINRCNLVLDKAAVVMGEDPSYTEGDYLADCSQMLALRSLCYFYLVRNFRDVPYITYSFTDSSQDRVVAQATPDSVLAGCIRDLETAEPNAIQAGAYNDWRRVGYFTKDAINALLADIYLWRGSVLHSAADYEKAVECCDKIIASKKKLHVKSRNEVDEKDYWLAEGKGAFSEIFITGNSEESILELQFQSGVNNNNGINYYYNRYKGSNGQPPFLYASTIFECDQSIYTPNNTAKDWRGIMNTFNDETNAGDFPALRIRKYVSNQDFNPSNTNIGSRDRYSNYTNNGQNFILYRLSDVMLMKAEALVELAADNSDVETLREAFDLVYEVNLRSMNTDDMSDDALKWGTYYSTTGTIDTKTELEKLVLQERCRELAFEGKRWYDLLRYSYRHMEGVNYDMTLAEQADREIPFAETYSEMLNLMKRKLSTAGNAVAAKMATEEQLYLPIPETDISVSPLLRQNPNYKATENMNKN